jgi:hypothetical protein
MKTAALGLTMALIAVTGARALSQPEPITELTTTTGLQVAVGACATVDARKENGVESKSLLAAILASVVTKGVSAFGTAVAKLGEEKTWSQTAARNFDTVGGTKFPQCVQVARGTFVTNGSAPANWTLAGWPDKTASVIAANGLTLSAAPDFLFEGEFVTSKTDPGAMTIRPARVVFIKATGEKVGKAERSIALFFALSTPGNKPSLATNPGATLILGPMQPRSARTFPALSESSPRVSSSYETAWFTLAKADAAKPLTISVLETETQDANKFLKFVGSVLSDKTVTDELAEQGKILVVPGAANDAETKKAIADLTATQAAAEKYGVAVVKVQACMSTTAPLTDAPAAIKALNDYYAADQAAPVPKNRVTPSMIAAIDPSKPEATVKAACTTVYAALAQ